MTLAVSFIRKLPNRHNRHEIVFASDSRLSDGQRLDHGPKIFALPRADALFAFAGDTHYAYPLAHHLIISITMYPRSVDRRFPLRKALGQMLRVFAQTYRSIHTLPRGELLPNVDDPPVQFLFGGYVWHDDAFRIWCIDLNRNTRSFRFRRGGQFFFIGDAEAVAEARARTLRLLNSRSRSVHEIDMEPFEVLRDVIREANHPYIGGVPQIAKVYRHMNTQFFLTLWESRGSRVPHVFGRPLLPNESSIWPEFDPDSLRFCADHDEVLELQAHGDDAPTDLGEGTRT